MYLITSFSDLFLLPYIQKTPNVNNIKEYVVQSQSTMPIPHLHHRTIDSEGNDSIEY